MTTNQHGGQRQPARPAAVSGPGALSARTDGGAGSKTQPIRVASGGAYGERKAAEEQQAGAPMAGGPPSVPTGTGGGNLAPPPAAGGGAFGPTQRPNESNMMGAEQPMNPVAQNPQAFLRVLYSQFPHPAIARLVDWSATKGETRQ